MPNIAPPSNTTIQVIQKNMPAFAPIKLSIPHRRLRKPNAANMTAITSMDHLRMYVGNRNLSRSLGPHRTPNLGSCITQRCNRVASDDSEYMI